jgi:hypothetical protein
VQSVIMECVLTIIQSVGTPLLKVMDPWRWQTSWLTPYGILQPYLQNWTAKFGDMGLYQLRMKSTFHSQTIWGQGFDMTLYNIVARGYTI